MSKDKNKVSENTKTLKNTKTVTIIKEHPLCGNAVGDVCDLPVEFAEMLIAEKFAE